MPLGLASAHALVHHSKSPNVNRTLLSAAAVVDNVQVIMRVLYEKAKFVHRVFTAPHRGSPGKPLRKPDQQSLLDLQMNSDRPYHLASHGYGPLDVET